MNCDNCKHLKTCSNCPKKIRNYWHKYCSMKCSVLGRTSNYPIKQKCYYCLGEFIRKLQTSQKNQTKNFCNKSCYNEYRWLLRYKDERIT